MIEVKNLYKEFTNDDVVTKVLHELSFDIKEGEFISIMGPSGSGKSTLMHILGFLDTLTKGQYKFRGQDVSNLDDDKLAELRNKSIGFVFQNFNLLPKTSVWDNVHLPLLYSTTKKSASIVDQVIESVGLTHRKDYLSNQLSGGEKQRVAIARALVNSPDIVFADEPTGNLDSKSGLQVMSILQELNKNGKTVILVTHETSTAQHAKRIIKLKDGKLISDDSDFKQIIAKSLNNLK
ncbi:ABC transporter ATP-binding protein [bacterium]|jgi:putative ABC transport system ATP-binding protein|nr:ABC transporter ATP-binding protein [bacterium]MBT4649435.1 ABC transporter ATP-binding protein [bacterium]